jgi:hypothetical protein
MSSKKSAEKTPRKPQKTTQEPANYEGVPILRYYPGQPTPGFSDYQEKLDLVCTAKFGKLAKFFKTGQHYVPPTPKTIPSRYKKGSDKHAIVTQILKCEISEYVSEVA